MEENGKEVSLLLQYEHLPHFCFACGIIGHHYKECTQKQFDPQESSSIAKIKYEILEQRMISAAILRNGENGKKR
ncbi:Zinc knuckle CX2CX4HX4C [Parasponia andersonii]|uniref:Zinc knuckle CX2CX4HX4C n=1 Tax=Parasponia andersonii TaxID=3476 RepID=A0A2P5DGI1_PARAD|nr:Zinc knuckle CX2CX4HX4C [Parasponia andersonii]